MMAKYRNYILAFVICLILGTLMGYEIKSPKNIETNDTLPDTTEIIPPIVDTVEVVDSLVVEEEIVINIVKDPKLEGKNYSLQVEALHAEKYNVTYEIWDTIKVKRLAKSETGIFKNIPGCNAGKYRVCVKDSSCDTVLAKRSITGFNNVEQTEEPGKKISKEALQSLINKKPLSLIRHPQVSRNITINVVGSTDNLNFSNINSYFQYNQWESIIVKDLQYDDKNKVNYILIEPIIK